MASSARLLMRPALPGRLGAPEKGLGGQDVRGECQACFPTSQGKCSFAVLRMFMRQLEAGGGRENKTGCHTLSQAPRPSESSVFFCLKDSGRVIWRKEMSWIYSDAPPRLAGPCSGVFVLSLPMSGGCVLLTLGSLRAQAGVSTRRWDFTCGQPVHGSSFQDGSTW